ncbi:hypothetical protein QOZ80_4BG0336160 [Eleusine coracana subsp. coracana]|nr:hypothetical protein QOZ80_4BG0336160 [Eleusine coracana subsp. coracana]
MAAKGSEGTAGVVASSSSLPATQEGSHARKYTALCIKSREAREKEDEAILARVATLRDREERLAAIITDLRKMEAQRRAAGVRPTDAELAAYIILRESADAALEGLPTFFGPME